MLQNAMQYKNSKHSQLGSSWGKGEVFVALKQEKKIIYDENNTQLEGQGK